MPAHASGVTPVTASCQPSARVPGAPSENGCWRVPGPVRGVGVGVGANAGTIRAGNGVGVGSTGRLGKPTAGCGTAGLAVSGGVGSITSGSGRSPSAGGSGGGDNWMLV